MHIKERFPQKLLVEGNDDQHVVWALCEQFHISETFDVVDCSGIDKIFDTLPIRFKQSAVQTIGVIIDADTNISSRWESLTNIFSKQQIALPAEPPADGFVINRPPVKIGVWLMPNNNLNGMLEDFIKFLVPNDDQLLPVVTENIKDIEKRQLHKYKDAHHSKALIHAWLALQEDPGTPMGLAITKRYLTTEEENCRRFIGWLNRMFNA